MPANDRWDLIRSLKFKSLNGNKIKFHRNGIWRRSVRISRKNNIRITIIKQKVNVARSLLENIKNKQLQWFGHVQRTEEGRLPKEVMKLRPPRRRKRGRPKLTCADGFRGLMGERGLREEDWNDRSN